VARGRALNWSAIEAIEKSKDALILEDPWARRARAYGYTSLLHEAGRRGAFPEVLELLARERGEALPRECLLMATADSERTLLLVLGARGELVGHFEETRRKRLPVRLDGLVPEPLLAPLRACTQVEVLARPPLHGRAGLLPPELAWSYLTRSVAPRPPRPGPAVHLVVSDVELPSHSTFKRFTPWRASFGPDEQRVELSGARATPKQVLAAMRRASEIDVVAHGIINGSSNSSYLLLSPEQQEGDGQLSVLEVRGATLERGPFVVLAACHAAHTSYTVDAPFSLPAAFIEAGARGVLAATVEIPDREANAFFNAVRERLRAGEAPALALREERLRWRSENPRLTWLDSVLLFE
jgi:cellulose synthase operon protein C